MTSLCGHNSYSMLNKIQINVCEFLLITFDLNTESMVKFSVTYKYPGIFYHHSLFYHNFSNFYRAFSFESATHVDHSGSKPNLAVICPLKLCGNKLLALAVIVLKR